MHEWTLKSKLQDSPSIRWLSRGSKWPFSAMRFMFFLHDSKFFKISPALSEAEGSEDSLYFIVMSIRMPPVTDPIFSHRSLDFESSNKKEIDARLTDK